MTCADVERQLDSFVDAALPGPLLLEVARHAGTCTACDEQIRQRTVLHQLVESAVRSEIDGLDLSGVWPAVAARIEHAEARRAWARRLHTVRRPLLAAAVAIAAGLLFWVRPADLPPVKVAARTLRNQAYIDRLDTSGAHLGVRRERRAGTTIIWVSADGGESGQ